jgi:hypothetical protein
MERSSPKLRVQQCNVLLWPRLWTTVKAISVFRCQGCLLKMWRREHAKETLVYCSLTREQSTRTTVQRCCCKSVFALDRHNCTQSKPNCKQLCFKLKAAIVWCAGQDVRKMSLKPTPGFFRDAAADEFAVQYSYWTTNISGIFSTEVRRFMVSIQAIRS